jgi:hypothetical protein
LELKISNTNDQAYHWSWKFKMLLTLLPIGAHWSPLELKILYDTWWSPLELMELVELVEFVPKQVQILYRPSAD